MAVRNCSKSFQLLRLIRAHALFFRGGDAFIFFSGPTGLFMKRGFRIATGFAREKALNERLLEPNRINQCHGGKQFLNII